MPDSLDPEKELFSVVIIGDFNPAIFHPSWFSSNDLLPEEETKSAHIDFIAKEIAAFSIGGISIQVSEDRLAYTTNEPQYEPVILDLIRGTLMLLEHTPIKTMGLNRDMVFNVGSDAARNDLGFRLAPRENWDSIGVSRGMKQLTIEVERDDCSAKFVQFRVSPSYEVLNGVFIGVNQHYLLETPERTTTKSRHQEALRILGEEWRPFMEFARDAANKVITPSKNNRGGA